MTLYCTELDVGQHGLYAMHSSVRKGKYTVDKHTALRVIVYICLCSGCTRTSHPVQFITSSLSPLCLSSLAPLLPSTPFLPPSLLPFYTPFCTPPPFLKPSGAFWNCTMLADHTKEHAEDVISPTSKAKPAGSKKGRHTRSHSSSFDWMYAGGQAETHMCSAASADTAGHDSVANPQSVSAAAIERMYGIKPVIAA